MAAGRAYSGVVAAAAPTLGVTAVLAALWLLATLVGLVDGGTYAGAVALDPGRTGSIVDGWGIGLLGFATLLALSRPGARLLALTPGLLLLGDAGELHLRCAAFLVGGMGSSGALPIAKLVAGLALGGLALVPLLVRHRSCFDGLAYRRELALLLAGGGAAAAGLDLCEHAAGARGREILVGAEEWIEVWLYALLAHAYLVWAVDWSRIKTNGIESRAGLAAFFTRRPNLAASRKIPVP